MPPSIAKLFPRFPASEDFPIKSVIDAPANTPTIFINPYAVALFFAGTNWQRIGILLASNIPKPMPKQSAALITLNKECPKPRSSSEGMVNDKPMTLVYILPRIFTPRNDDAAMVIVDKGPAFDIGIFRFCANKVGSQFFVAQPGKLGTAK